jgi:16S rRNA (cytosine1402-N4)-methyltransferase
MRLKALGRSKPSDAEILANPRARSAVMRVAERTEVPA